MVHTLCSHSNSKHWFTTSFPQLAEGAGKRCSGCVVVVQRCGIHVVQRRRGLKLQALVYDILPPEGAGKRCSECVVVNGSASLYNGDAVRTGSRPTRPSTIAFRHLPPDSATEEAHFSSAQLSTDAVSALRKVRVLI